MTLDIFCVRPFALHRQQTEKDKQNVDFALPWKNFCGRPCRCLAPGARDRIERTGKPVVSLSLL